MDLQHYQEAYKELSQAVDLDPKHFKARLALGSLLMAARQFSDSGQSIPRTSHCEARYVVKHDPNNADGFVLLGNA